MNTARNTYLKEVYRHESDNIVRLSKELLQSLNMEAKETSNAKELSQKVRTSLKETHAES